MAQATKVSLEKFYSEIARINKEVPEKVDRIRMYRAQASRLASLANIDAEFLGIVSGVLAVDLGQQIDQVVACLVLGARRDRRDCATSGERSGRPS